jgi:hypothetical protein
VIDDGKSKLISFEDNCQINHIEITNNDVESAVKSGSLANNLQTAANVVYSAVVFTKLTIRNP